MFLGVSIAIAPPLRIHLGPSFCIETFDLKAKGAYLGTLNRSRVSDLKVFDSTLLRTTPPFYLSLSCSTAVWLLPRSFCMLPHSASFPTDLTICKELALPVILEATAFTPLPTPILIGSCRLLSEARTRQSRSKPNTRVSGL